jgi:hypothetical protein
MVQHLARGVVTGPGWAELQRHGPCWSAGDPAQARVGCDAKQPVSQRAPPLEVGQPPPGPHQDVLQNVVGVIERTHHAVAQGAQLCPVWPYQYLEGGLVAMPRRIKHVRIVPQVRHQPFHVWIGRLAVV